MSHYQNILAKITTVSDLQNLRAEWKAAGQQVVFTNGCFDILHKGHVTYLAKSADLGQKMIVAINSDRSVKAQAKGPERPINDEAARSLLLASLEFVSAVVVFDNDTPLEEIKALLPDVLVKGSDYDAEEKDPTSKRYIVGSDIVLAHGGTCRTIDLVAGFSTTNLVAKLKS